MIDRGGAEGEHSPFKEQIKGLAQRAEQIVNTYEQTVRSHIKSRFEREIHHTWVQEAIATFENEPVPINFVSAQEPDKIIKVSRLSPQQEKDVEIFDAMPDNFSLPAYYLWTTDYSDKNVPRTTPYGLMPGYVIGSDEELYSIANAYYFNAAGQSVTMQEIAQVDKDDIPKMGNLAKVDFVPELGNHEAPFKGGDLENIIFLLEQIESGQYTLGLR